LIITWINNGRVIRIDLVNLRQIETHLGDHHADHAHHKTHGGHAKEATWMRWIMMIGWSRDRQLLTKPTRIHF